MGDIIDLLQYALTKELVIRTDRDLTAVSVPEKMPSVDFSFRNIKLHTYEPPVEFRVNIWDRAAVDPLNLAEDAHMQNPENGGGDKDEILLSAEELGMLDEMDLGDFNVDDSYGGEEEYAALNEPMTVGGFISALQQFFHSLPDIKRGNVFVSESGDGACLNVLIGMPFANAEPSLKQINVIVAPTDREFLQSTGTAIDDSVEQLDPVSDEEIVDALQEMGKEALREACRRAGIKYGKMNNDDMREALAAHDAFNKARDFIGGNEF